MVCLTCSASWFEIPRTRNVIIDLRMAAYDGERIRGYPVLAREFAKLPADARNKANYARIWNDKGKQVAVERHRREHDSLVVVA
jgi:hypothetical protein